MGQLLDTSTTTFKLVFLGLMFLGAVFLWVMVLDRPVKQKLSNAAAQQYGEDLVSIAEIVAKDIVPRFPHLPIDEVTRLVMTAVASKSKADAKLYEATIRGIVERVRGGGAEQPGPVTRWTD